MTKIIKPRKLSIITTLGPSSSSAEIIRELLPLSSQFRLNSSHLSPDELDVWLSKLKKTFSETNITIPVVVDLQGAKMRIGIISSVKELPKGIYLVQSDSSDDESVLPIPHRRFFEHVQKGEELLLNDGRITIKIIDRIPIGAPVASGGAPVASDDDRFSKCTHAINKKPPKNNQAWLKASVLSNGPLSSRKGINRKQHPVPFHEINDKDREMISVLNKYDFTSIAISFIVDGSEIALVRELSHKKIAAKIERPESFQHLQTIAENSHEVWLCRGDLGAQAGLWEMARLQIKFEEFIKTWNDKSQPDPNNKNKGKLTSSTNGGLTKKGGLTDFYLAGQVFEHMTKSAEPTRSEVSHFYNSSLVGYKGIVLSDETAVGENPVATLNFIRNLQSEAEKREH